MLLRSLSIEGLLAAVSDGGSTDPPVDAAVAPVEEDPNRPKTRSKSSTKSDKRQRSRSPVDRSHDTLAEVSSPEVNESRTLAEDTVPPAPNQTVRSPDTVHGRQDITSQEPLIDLPFFTSDDDAGSLSDTSLGLSLGDVSGLEEIIDKYKAK